MPDFTTSSFSLNSSLSYYSVTASFALTSSNVETSSYSISSSYADRAGIANTASFTVSSSYSDYSQFSDTSNTSQTSSFAYISNFAYLANNANTSSYTLSSSWSDSSSQAISSSYALSSSWSDFSSQAISSSYALSSSWSDSSSQAISSSYTLSSSWATSASRAISASYADYAATCGGGSSTYGGIFSTIDSNFLSQFTLAGYGNDNLFFVGNNYYQINTTVVSTNVAYLKDFNSNKYSVFNFDPTNPSVSLATAQFITASLIQYISSGEKYVWLSSSTSPIPSGTTLLKTWSYDNIWFYGRYYAGNIVLPNGSYDGPIRSVQLESVFELSSGVLSWGSTSELFFNGTYTTLQSSSFYPANFVPSTTDLSYKYWKLFLNFFSQPYGLYVSATNYPGSANFNNNFSILNNFSISASNGVVQSLKYYYQNTLQDAYGGFLTTISGISYTNPLPPSMN